MSQSIFPGPIASENNPPIEPQWFQPSAFPIATISLGTTTSVTTTAVFDVDCNYVVGQLVRFVIPPTFGARQLNEKQGYVVSVPGTNQIVVNINTSQNFDAFIPSPSYSTTPAQIMAIGDVNTGGSPNTGRSDNALTINGTFQNISPSAGG